MPLIVETLILAAIFYLIGVAIGWFLFGRPKRQGFL